MTNKVLEIGDIIYILSASGVVGKFKIVRTTNTLAISENGTKFKRAVPASGVITPIGASTWGSISYELETPELQEQWERKMAVYKIKNTKWDKIPTETIRLILKTINESKSK